MAKTQRQISCYRGKSELLLGSLLSPIPVLANAFFLTAAFKRVQLPSGPKAPAFLLTSCLNSDMSFSVTVSRYLKKDVVIILGSMSLNVAEQPTAYFIPKHLIVKSFGFFHRQAMWQKYCQLTSSYSAVTETKDFNSCPHCLINKEETKWSNCGNFAVVFTLKNKLLLHWKAGGWLSTSAAVNNRNKAVKFVGDTPKRYLKCHNFSIARFLR